tara:strand:- start:1510 stop:1998 length:489 start_codon:yes stop_codon:yes gene_type:complete
VGHVQYVDLFPAVVSVGARPVSESPLRRLLRSPRRVYLLEAVVCFGPLVILLGLGLLQLPLVFAEDQPQGAAWLFSALLLGGFCGLWGVSQLVLRVIQPQRQVGSPRAIVLMLLLGIGCLLGFYGRWQLSPSATLMLIVLPLLGSAHFLFLARDYLVRRPRA